MYYLDTDWCIHTHTHTHRHTHTYAHTHTPDWCAHTQLNVASSPIAPNYPLNTNTNYPAKEEQLTFSFYQETKYATALCKLRTRSTTRCRETQICLIKSHSTYIISQKFKLNHLHYSSAPYLKGSNTTKIADYSNINSYTGVCFLRAVIGGCSLGGVKSNIKAFKLHLL